MKLSCNFNLKVDIDLTKLIMVIVYMVLSAM